MLKYRYKMIWLFSMVSVTTLLVFLALDILVTQLIGGMVLKKNIEYVDTVSQKIVQEVDYMRQKASSVFDFLQYNELLQFYFDDTQKSVSLDTAQKLSAFLISINMIYKELDDIALVGKNRLYTTSLREQDINRIIDEMPELSNMQCGGIMVQVGLNNEKYKIISYLSNIYGNQTGQTKYAQSIGMALLSFRLTKLNWGETGNQNNTQFFVMDKNRNYYTINCDDEKAQMIIAHLNPAHIDEEIDNRDFLLKTTAANDSELYVISYTDKSLLLKDVSYVQMLTLLLGVICFLAILVIAVVVFKSVISPIYTIKNHMMLIAAGNFIRLKKKLVVSGSREIVELTDSLNAMTDELDDRAHRLFATANRLYEMEMEKQKAEIAFLRSQINPHFLYNSLETIRGICMKNNLPEGAAVASNLGKIFRYSIKGGGIVSFREEVLIAKAYVEIQKTRFPQKVEVVYNLADETMDIPVANMILQPIIENVFQHSIEKSSEKTMLYIAAALKGDDMLVTVQDDGVGISPQKLEELNRFLESGTFYDSCHVGITNVNLRLRMMYGEGYGLVIESKPFEGTKVVLKMKAKVNAVEVEREETRDGADSNYSG